MCDLVNTHSVLKALKKGLALAVEAGCANQLVRQSHTLQTDLEIVQKAKMQAEGRANESEKQISTLQLAHAQRVLGAAQEDQSKAESRATQLVQEIGAKMKAEEHTKLLEKQLGALKSLLENVQKAPSKAEDCDST